MKVGGCVSLPVLQPAISEALERALQTQSASLRIYVKETVTRIVFPAILVFERYFTTH
jgi:hypothetical protein